MSEEILKALTQLFAIITKQDGGVTEKERQFVIGFFQQELDQDSIKEYLELYDKFVGYKKKVEGEAEEAPAEGEEKPAEGVVIAVGPGKRDDDGNLHPVSVNVDDRVLFGKYGGTEIKIDDKEHIILREDEVLGIIS